MSSIQNNNFQLFTDTVLDHAKIGNRFHINTLLQENYHRIPEDLKNKLIQIIKSFEKDSIRTIDRGLLESRVQDAISAQVEMQAHDTNKNPRLDASKTTPFNLLNDLKWTIYSYLDPRELTTLGYVSRSVQKIIFQDILAVLDRDLRSSITNLPLYVKAFHLSGIPDVFDISLTKYDKLKKLSLSNQNITNAQLVQIINRCPNLTEITLTNYQFITDAAVKELAAKCLLLRVIGLDGCRLITDAAVKELAAKYPLLIEIGLNGCRQITDAAVKELAAKCPLLTMIYLGNCPNITDAAVKELAAKYSLLTKINLGNSPNITDAAVKELAARCRQLRMINLCSCPNITDAAVKELAAKCPLLTMIYLINCPNITDAAVNKLAVNCRLLTGIYLSGTSITTISCIFLAKYSSKLQQIAATPELQAMFQQYKQAFSYKPYTELGKEYSDALNDIVNQKYGEINNPGFLNNICELKINNKINILKQIESEMFKKIDSLNEDDKNKFYLFIHQIAGRPPVPSTLQWGKENHKANYVRLADALHMLESHEMAGHDKPESKKE